MGTAMTDRVDVVVFQLEALDKLDDLVLRDAGRIEAIGARRPGSGILELSLNGL